MRTTVRLDPEVAAAAAELRRQQGLTLSAAVNQLARAGLLAESGTSQSRFKQTTAPLGLRIDVSNVAEALELLEGPEYQ